MEQKKFIIPKDIDEECINLVIQLNKLDGIETTESCCGHYKERYMIFFQCTDFITLGKLYRCVDRNYSDGNWRIECCCSDSIPTHGFLLISKNVFINKEEMETSINELISNILYWTQTKFNNYFNGIKDKELLLKDLCARLSYGVKCNVGEKIPYTLCRIEIDNVNGHLLDFIETKDGLDMQVYLSEVKPYLFPLSSMTKEQEEEYGKCYDIDLKNSAKNLKDRLDGKDIIDGYPMYNHIDWLNKNHFDYRGLIEKGLAIDANELNIY